MELIPFSHRLMERFFSICRVCRKIAAKFNLPVELCSCFMAINIKSFLTIWKQWDVEPKQGTRHRSRDIGHTLNQETERNCIRSAISFRMPCNHSRKKRTTILLSSSGSLSTLNAYAGCVLTLMRCLYETPIKQAKTNIYLRHAFITRANNDRHTQLNKSESAKYRVM